MRKVRSMVMARGWLALAPLLLVACGGSGDGPTVFFVSPEEGGTYPADSPVAFEFGMDNYELGAVPEEVSQVRAGVGASPPGAQHGLPRGRRGDSARRPDLGPFR